MESKIVLSLFCLSTQLSIILPVFFSSLQECHDSSLNRKIYFCYLFYHQNYFQWPFPYSDSSFSASYFTFPPLLSVYVLFQHYNLNFNHLLVQMDMLTEFFRALQLLLMNKNTYLQERWMRPGCHLAFLI